MRAENGSPLGFLMRQVGRLRRNDEPEPTQAAPRVWLSGAPTVPMTRPAAHANMFDPLDLAFFAMGDAIAWDTEGASGDGAVVQRVPALEPSSQFT